MIVLSFLLVVIAAVTLLVGLFQDTLTWIWISIGSCVLAMIFLGIGVLQRRSSRRVPEDAEEPAYGPGAITSLIPGSEDEEEEPAAASREEVTVVPKRSVSDARDEMSRADVEEAADQAVAKAEADAPTERAAAKKAQKRSATKMAKKAAKKSVKKAQKRSAKKAAKKTTAKKAAKKTTAKKAAKKTTGKAARERLDQVKGLGPAKQKRLLSEFGSLEGIRDAGIEDLLQVKGIGEATAEEIRKQLA